MVICFKADVSTSPVSYIQQTTPKLTVHHRVIDLVADLMTGSVLEQSVINDEAGEVAEIHEPSTVRSNSAPDSRLPPLAFQSAKAYCRKRGKSTL